MKQIIKGFLVLALAMGSTAFAHTIFVPDDADTIQQAIDMADSGDTVIVRDGLYSGPGFCDIRFWGKLITVKSENGPETCILEGNGTETAFWFDQDETLDTVLAGFTLRNFGTAVHIYSEATIFDCIFEDNYDSEGGSAVTSRHAVLYISGCIFRRNLGGAWGGAMQLDYTTGVIADSVFDSNINDVRFGNYDSYGGAVCALWSAIDFINCLFINNSVKQFVHSPYGGIAGALFLDNATQDEPFRFVNCTFFGNTAENGATTGGIYAIGPTEIRNCVFWYNTAPGVAGNALDVQYSVVQGGFYGDGNIALNPEFYQPEKNLFYVLPISPCLNAGDRPSEEICFDTYDDSLCLDAMFLSIENVPDQDTVDIGFHYRIPFPMPPTPDPCFETGVELSMPANHFYPGEVCSLTAYVCNMEGSTLTGYPLFVVLDVFGEFYWGPGFSSDVDWYLSQYPEFPPLETVIDVIQPFSWPHNTGSADGLVFIAAITDPAVSMTVGNWSSWEFGWSDTNPPTPTPTPTPEGFVYILPGTYTRGSPEDEPCREGDPLNFDETQHQVTLTRGFYMMTTAVTRQMWADLKAAHPWLPNDPSLIFYSPTMDHPVQRVKWNEVVLFANIMSELHGYTRCYYKNGTFTIPVDATNYTIGSFYCDFDANGYRLPTEAEWEYAARAGTTGPFSAHEPNFSEETCDTDTPDPPLSILDSIAWWSGNAEKSSHPVGAKLPNPWGLYDMHGNVWEWCWDAIDVYPSGPVTDPTGPTSGSIRVVRGGGWESYAHNCRSAERGASNPALPSRSLGFRLLRLDP